jgi:hypothetical protein
MDTELLERQFARMGARLKVGQPSPRVRVAATGFSVDIRQDARGPYFDVIVADAAEQEVEVLDLQPGMRHLLLLIRQPDGRREEKHKFLCGHDERDWFAAAVPEGNASTVLTAMEALKPGEVLQAQARKRLKRRNRNRRHNKAFIRQGEWFFIPEPDLVVDPKLVLSNEPLARGRGKPHRADFAYRTGGETVYVSRDYPLGLTEPEYKRLLAEKPSMKRLPWTAMRRDAGVYVRGRVRHPDHKTIHLDVWHRVLPNTENKAAAMRHLAFLD